jgi:hypothetical protein
VRAPVVPAPHIDADDFRDRDLGHRENAKQNG